LIAETVGYGREPAILKIDGRLFVITGGVFATLLPAITAQ
jgi:hypothetical protein